MIVMTHRMLSMPSLTKFRQRIQLRLLGFHESLFAALPHLGLLLTLAVVAVNIASPVRAQEEGLSVDPPLSVSNSSTASLFSDLAADKSGLVHLVWVEDVGGVDLAATEARASSANTILYATWDGERWSEPIDVRFVPIGQSIVSPKLTADERGFLHLVWFEGADRLKYSQAPINLAHSAQHWQPSIELDANAGAVEDGVSIVVDDQDVIHVAYAGGSRFRFLDELRSAKYTRSSDGGVTWSNPVELGKAQEMAHGMHDVRLHLDPAGRLHASWVEWNAQGFGEAVYYTRSFDGGDTWEAPTMVDQREPGMLPAQSYRDRFIVYSGDADHLFRFWISGFPADWFYQMSTDGGGSWGTKTRLVPELRGDQGPPTFARDSLGRLHMFIPQRGADGGPVPVSTIGLWHSMWLGQDWGRRSLVGPPDSSLFNPRAVMVRGNEFAITWWSHGVGEAMVMTGVVPDAPPKTPEMRRALAVELQPTAVPTAFAVTTATAQPSPSPVRLVDTAPPARAAPDAFSLALPVALVVALIGGVGLIHLRRMRR